MSAIVQRFPANTAGRDFVVGDLHCCRAMFDRLLAVAGFNPSVDRVFSVGDLIDRGPDSVGCIELLDMPWFHAVQGNHEALLHYYAEDGTDESARLWMINGGRWIRDYLPELERFAARLRALPYIIVVGEGLTRFNVLHAECYHGDAWIDAGQFTEPMLATLQWGRSIIGLSCDPPSGLSRTYVGHTIRPQVEAIGPFVYLDTGAFRGGPLTMAEPASGRVWQVEAAN